MSSRVKTGLLWLLLVGLFFSVVVSEGRARRLPEAPSLGARAEAWAPTGLALALLAAFLGALVLRTRGSDTWAATNDEGSRLLLAGNAPQARAVFQRLVVLGGSPQQQSVASCNLAAASLLSGKHREALATCEAAHADFGDHATPEWRVWNMALACCAASLAGELAAARLWHWRGRDLSASRGQPLRLLAEALLRAREGEDAAVAGLILERWDEAERCPTVLRKLLRVLRAFALSRSGLASVTEVREWLAGAKPLEVHALDFAATDWPELRAYLVAEGLTSEGPRALQSQGPHS
jgi:hypothetical protein